MDQKKKEKRIVAKKYKTKRKIHKKYRNKLPQPRTS